MIRPEIKEGLWRWREVIAALARAAVGLWWGTVSFGIVQWIGWALAALGVALAITAAQKMRFTQDGDVSNDPFYFGTYFQPGFRAQRGDAILQDLVAAGRVRRRRAGG